MIETGLDRLIAQDFSLLKGAQVGVLANQASCDGKLTHIIDLFTSTPNVSLVRIFAPEHGLRGEEQDMSPVADTVDLRTGIPVVSLYSNSEYSLRPAPETLAGLDTLVIDLQDVGSRYYTFAQTMLYCMEACGRAGVKVVVLDRPNPLGGILIEGALLEKDYRSFCGLQPVANRHGLTMCELAKLAQGGFGEGEHKTKPISCELELVLMHGYRREMEFCETGLPWLMPSPNMPTPDTALVYPGSCLFEATNISEGRGTTRPFEFIGAPYIDRYRWIEETLSLGIGLEGAALRPISFVPQFHKWAHKSCSGVQIHVTDRKTFKPFRLSLALLATAARLFGDSFAWRQNAYEFVENINPIDLLYGSFRYRKVVETKAELADLIVEIDKFERWYGAARRKYLLYP